MTVRQALRKGTQFLLKKGLRFPREDTELILCSVLRCDRTFLIAHSEHRLSAEARAQFREWLQKRGSHYPLQYLRGSQEFYGYPFKVGSGVLIPRPETEIVVDMALKYLRSELPAGARILDVGTGSGCLAVVLAKEQPDVTVIGLELSLKALSIARTNVQRAALGHRVFLACSDLLSGLANQPRFDLIVSNPPYVPLREWPSVDKAVRDFEPHEAVFAGEDGLRVYRPLFPEAGRVLRPSGLLVVELGHGIQDEALSEAKALGWQVCEVACDLSGRRRCAVLSRAEGHLPIRQAI